MKILSFDVGIKNLAFCVLDQDENICAWELFSLQPTSHVKVCTSLVNELDKRKDLWDTVDIILIEKQPKFNPIMRVIAGCLRMYFIIRHIVDEHKKVTIISYSPKHKLKCYEGIPFILTKGTAYTKRKKLSILHCEALIKDQEKKFCSYFKGEKKKDDLSDAFLQGLSYLRFKKKEPGKIICRKPTKKQIKYKKYSKSNVKFLIQNQIEKHNKKIHSKSINDYFGAPLQKVTLLTFIQQYIDQDKAVKKNIIRLYKGYDVTTINTIKKDLFPTWQDKDLLFPLKL